MEQTFTCEQPVTPTDAVQPTYYAVYWRLFWNGQRYTKTHLVRHFPERGYADISPEEAKTLCGETVMNYYQHDDAGIASRSLCKRCARKAQDEAERKACVKCGRSRHVNADGKCGTCEHLVAGTKRVEAAMADASSPYAD